GRSFQEARLYPSLSVAETVAVALERHLPNRDTLAAALALPASTVMEAAVEERVDELLALLGLTGSRPHRTAAPATGTRRPGPRAGDRLLPRRGSRHKNA